MSNGTFCDLAATFYVLDIATPNSAQRFTKDITSFFVIPPDTTVQHDIGLTGFFGDGTGDDTAPTEGEVFVVTASAYGHATGSGAPLIKIGAFTRLSEDQVGKPSDPEYLKKTPEFVSPLIRALGEVTASNKGENMFTLRGSSYINASVPWEIRVVVPSDNRRFARFKVPPVGKLAYARGPVIGRLDGSGMLMIELDDYCEPSKPPAGLASSPAKRDVSATKAMVAAAKARSPASGALIPRPPDLGEGASTGTSGLAVEASENAPPEDGEGNDSEEDGPVRKKARGKGKGRARE